MIYLDTSYIVKAYINEAGSDAVLEELADKTGLVSSELGNIEFTSALMRQRRAKQLTKPASDRAIRMLESDTADGDWTWIPIDSEITENAIRLLSDSKTYGNLRTLDAIHLATALQIKAEPIYTHYLRMLQAAQKFGLKAIDVIP